MTYKVNGKKLNGFVNKVGEDQSTCFDKHGNLLEENDHVLIVRSHVGYASTEIRKLVLFKEDTTQKLFLGFKLANGQYRALGGLDVFYVNEAFVSHHEEIIVV